VVTEAESGAVVLENLTPAQTERLWAAVSIVVDCLFERASLNNEEDETQVEVDSEPSVEP
jgi:hypothetical protein